MLREIRKRITRTLDYFQAFYTSPDALQRTYYTMIYHGIIAHRRFAIQILKGKLSAAHKFRRRRIIALRS